MTIILNNNQVKGDIRLINNSCLIVNLQLNYQQFTQIKECKDKTFNILINNKEKPILLKRCVKCAWGYVNKEGYTNMQINYWESELINIDEYRDIIINNLIKNNYENI
jgi:hypothetical protein